MNHPDSRQPVPPLHPLAAETARSGEKDPWYADGSLWIAVALTAATTVLWVVTGVDLAYSAVIMCLILSTSLATPSGDQEGWKKARDVAVAALLIVVGAVLIAPHGIGIPASARITQGAWGVLGGVAALAVIAAHRRISGRRRFRDASAMPARE